MSTSQPSSYFRHHVFVCTNQRDNGQMCCANHSANALQDYMKSQCFERGLSGGAGKVRINKAGCLERCNEGPVMVVYPEAVWYTFMDQSDIDEIITEHLEQGRPVERLMIDSPERI